MPISGVLKPILLNALAKRRGERGTPLGLGHSMIRTGCRSAVDGD